MPNALKVIANLLRRGEGGSEDNDTALVKAVLRGEHSAFDQLVIRYHELAYGLAYRMVQHTELDTD